MKTLGRELLKKYGPATIRTENNKESPSIDFTVDLFGENEKITNIKTGSLNDKDPTKIEDVLDKAKVTQGAAEKTEELNSISNSVDELKSLTEGDKSQDVTENLKESQDMNENLEISQDMIENLKGSQDLDENSEGSQDVNENLEESQDITQNLKDSQVVAEILEASQDINENKEIDSTVVTKKESQNTIEGLHDINIKSEENILHIENLNSQTISSKNEQNNQILEQEKNKFVQKRPGIFFLIKKKTGEQEDEQKKTNYQEFKFENENIETSVELQEQNKRNVLRDSENSEQLLPQVASIMKAHITNKNNPDSLNKYQFDLEKEDEFIPQGQEKFHSQLIPLSNRDSYLQPNVYLPIPIDDFEKESPRSLQLVPEIQ